MNFLFERTNFGGMIPKTIIINLPISKQKVSVTVHDIRQAIYSILTDDSLMKDENLIFQEDKPLTLA